MFCSKCGTKIPEGGKVCPNCGKPVAEEQNASANDFSAKARNSAEGFGKTAASAMKDFAQNISGTADGEKVDIHFKDLFSGVFRKHTQEEEDALFLCGTSKTTPDIHSISKEWPKPWLFSRIFLLLMLATLLLAFIVFQLGNTKGIPGLMFISSLTAPAAVITFFFETNAPRNISMYQVLKTFLIFGLLSLIFTIVLGNYVYQSTNLIGAIGIGFVEELGKAIAIALALNHIKTIGKRHYILNGLLLGSAVGGGFAVFETAGYVFDSFIGNELIDYDMFSGIFTRDLSLSYYEMNSTIIARSLLAIGGHVIWGAILGAALCIAADGGHIEGKHFLSGKFLGIFIIPLALHANWDLEYSLFNGDIKYIISIVIAWIVGLVLVSRGMKEVNNIMENGKLNSKGEIVV